MSLHETVFMLCVATDMIYTGLLILPVASTCVVVVTSLCHDSDL